MRLTNIIKKSFDKGWLIEVPEDNYDFTFKLEDLTPLIGPDIHYNRNKKKGINDGKMPRFLIAYQMGLIAALVISFSYHFQ